MPRSRPLLARAGWLVAGLAAAACSSGSGNPGATQTTAGGGAVADLMKARGLSEADVTAALKTYTPTGRHDEYLLFGSGGHSGQVVVIGLPSMRILKYIGVFTPEPWQGWGFDDASKAVLAGGNRHGKEQTWADTHHPALSETKGDYDGQYLFIGDKAGARVAVIDLKDFTTKQIISSHVIESDHGAAFVTPNTEYIVEGSQYPAPLGGEYADVSQFKEKYRGGAVFWKFDRDKGRIDPAKSFVIELPPYVQDLSDAGKLGIGVDSNQNGLQPGKVLTSMVKRVDNACYDVVKEVLDGKFQGGFHVFGLDKDGVAYAMDENNRNDRGESLIPGDVILKVEQAKADIISGKIKVTDAMAN